MKFATLMYLTLTLGFMRVGHVVLLSSLVHICSSSKFVGNPYEKSVLREVLYLCLITKHNNPLELLL